MWMLSSEYGPDALRDLDIKAARSDPRHKAKKLEQRIKALWWRVAKWALRKGTAKTRITERERIRRRK